MIKNFANKFGSLDKYTLILGDYDKKIIWKEKNQLLREKLEKSLEIIIIKYLW